MTPGRWQQHQAEGQVALTLQRERDRNGAVHEQELHGAEERADQASGDMHTVEVHAIEPDEG